MNTLDDQIRVAHGAGATIEEICEQFNCSEMAVKWAVSDREDFSDSDCRDMAAVIKQVALNGDNERNRLTAAMYIYDVKKGLRVPKKESPTISAVQINQLIYQSQQDVYQLIGASGEHRKGQSDLKAPDQPTEDKEPNSPAGGDTDTATISAEACAI